MLDKTYFMNELRQKRLEIINVTTTMKVRWTLVRHAGSTC